MRHFLNAVVGFVILFSGVGTSSAAAAAEQCSSLFLVSHWEISARVQKNKFVTNRDLFEYGEVLHKDFKDSLQKLSPEQHWIDLGAGKANAQIAYIKSFPHSQSAAQATAVAYKLDRWFSPPKFDGKLQVKEGAFETQPTHTWKKADLVTDVFGVVSYTHDLHTSLQKVFDMMNVKGEFYIYASNYHTSVRVSEKTSLSLIDFLATIDGLRVEGRYGTIKITKEKENVTVPQLELLKYKDDAPPSRSFRVVP
ncbi:hypothetical protein QJS83_08075 [Bdellovibrio sp. 22V]|uniref:hypothetical protein n=1 Tax=Bdellovibrio sp. 22V TaxID=3044166 RepID=UPI002542AC1D|nr:hypothetical protein [Bdellovibrio sp. 22V]WII73833.1 hypothetical protein QJS83_08075 [Bdellovibrio sp. 22V]